MYRSTKVDRSYLEAGFQPGDFIVFGKETRGLPEELLAANPDTSMEVLDVDDIKAIARESFSLIANQGCFCGEAFIFCKCSPLSLH